MGGRNGGEEAFRLISRGSGYRLGLSVAQERANPRRRSLELLLRILIPGVEVDPSSLGNAMTLVRTLRERGFSVTYQGDGWICCLRTVDVKEASIEADWVLERLGKTVVG